VLTEAPYKERNAVGYQKRDESRRKYGDRKDL